LGSWNRSGDANIRARRRRVERTNDDHGGVMNLLATAIRVTLLLSAAVGLAHRVGIADAIRSVF
jgi:hypothetical protein